MLDSSALISSFGEGARGEIYVADLNGTVYHLDRSP
jgi:predicted heme/steroid binding protein